MKTFLHNIVKFAKKLWKRFSNYNHSKKWFVLYLIILTFILLLPPIVKINGMSGVEGSQYSLLFSSAYFRSLIVILISLLFLLGRNISIKFKSFVVYLFALREDEPLVDFAFLWVITSVFMGIVDTVGVAHIISERISLTSRAVISELLLGVGLIWSFISLWLSAKKNSKKAKILTIVEESATHQKPVEIANQPKRPMQHLFDDVEE
ncbi:MAG: hypothetical protein LBU27_07445 [Candidatus Peribacteria bacterium]|nr:hypothetical protein [Candidatus Peribacteria bacterium]